MSRPKVTVGVRETDTAKGWIAVCFEDRCGWAYPRAADQVAVKSDAEQQARWHREVHRRVS